MAERRPTQTVLPDRDQHRRAARDTLPGATLSIGAGLGATIGIVTTGTVAGLLLGGGVGAAVGLIAGAAARSLLAASGSPR